MMDTRNHLILVRKDFQNLAPLLGLMKVMKRANFTSQMALEKVVVQAFTGNNLKSKVKEGVTGFSGNNLYEGSGKSESYRETIYAGKCCISSWF